MSIEKMNAITSVIKPMVIRPAAQLDQVTARMLAYTPHSVTVGKASPGAYGMAFGTGKLDPDAIAMLLAPTGCTIPRAVENSDACARFFRDPTLVQRLFEKLFPRKQQTLSKNQVVLTIWDVQKAIGDAAASSDTQVEGELLSVIAEVIMFLLASARFVQPSRGLNYRDLRTSRYPGRDEFLLEAVRADLRDHLAKSDLRLELTTTKFAPALLQEQMTEVLGRLGRALMNVSWSYKRMADAMYAVYRTIVLPETQAERLPEEIANSAVLQELRSNYTFMKASLTGLPLSPSNTPWDYQNSLTHAAQVLATSPRYETVSIQQAAAIYNITHLEDTRRNATVTLVTPKIEFDHKIVVGQVSQLASAAVPATELLRLPDMEDIFGRLTAETVTNASADSFHALLSSVLSAVTLDDTSLDARTNLISVNVIDEEDYTVMALREASITYLDVDPDTGDVRVVFEVPLERRRIFSDTIPVEDKVITLDPATAIIAGRDRAATLAFSTKHQIVPIEMYDGYFLGNQDGHFSSLVSSYKLKVAIGDTKQTIELQPVEILGLQPRPSIAQVEPFLDRKLYGNFLLSCIDVASWVAKHEYNEGDERLSFTAQQQLRRTGCHAVNMALARVYGTSAGKQVIAKLARVVTASASATDRQRLYKLLNREEYASQLRIKGAMLLLATTGWLSEADMLQLLNEFEATEFYIFQRSALPLEGDQRLA